MADVTHRIQFYEWVTRNGKQVMKFLPFYLVEIKDSDGLNGGRIFEVQTPGTVAGRTALVELHELQELDAGRIKLLYEDTCPEGPMRAKALHAYSACDIPTS